MGIFSKRPVREAALKLLQSALNDPQGQFRDAQFEAIEQLVTQRARLLVVQRTGWGKSMIYFLATRLLRDQGSGPTLLISPLLALMRNQMLAAERLNLRAETINSSNPDEWETIRGRLKQNEIDLLLISPERLANDKFREQTLATITGSIGLLVVDEAHCISDWGHDFRPDYRRIVRIVRMLPRNTPVLTVTATANDRVVKDIVAQLGSSLRVLRGPLGRDSLRLQNIVLPDQASRLAWLEEVIPTLPGSGIIYALTVQDAKRISAWLTAFGIDVPAYYGALENDKREVLEQRLLENDVKALAATTALGMGFDKPDLHFVIHFQRPASVIHYYQQVGRAGRAVQPAYGILLSGAEDDEIAEYFQKTALPPDAHVLQVLEILEQSEDGFSVSMLERELNLSRSQLLKVITCLTVEEPSPIVRLKSRWHRTPVAYQHDASRATKLLEVRQWEQMRMRQYVETRDCLMSFLRRELDDTDLRPCGSCANCSGETLLPTTPSTRIIQSAQRFLRLGDEEIPPRIMWIGDSLQSHSWKGKIPEALRAETGRSMGRWGDSGWGEFVRRGKLQDNRYANELVGGAADLIRKRWLPEPAPEWVCCIPSLRHPELVPDFARRLATALKLPFVSCIEKTKSTAPQKDMHNSYQQSHNLSDSFRVESTLIRPAPVLLIDDMVDSRWTFTVIAALLRDAGSGPVFPLALAKSFAK
jgi:ATP-dependent DNA helicase RecQ